MYPLIAFLVLVAACASPPRPTGLARPPTIAVPPVNPALITATLRPVDVASTPGGHVITFEYTIQNGNVAPIYIVSLRQMPFIEVLDPGNAVLHFDMPAPEGGTLGSTFFLRPQTLRLGGGASQRRPLRIEVPLRESSPERDPGAPVATGSTVAFRVMHGYADTRFAPANVNTVEAEFFAWQKVVTSAPVVVGGL